MDLCEKTVNSEYRYTGKIINLRLDTVVLPNGATALREVVEHPGAVAVVPVCDGGEVALVRQYRHSLSAETLEIPAGKLELAEQPGPAGERELYEETGAHAGHMEYLGCIYPSAGCLDEIVHIYLATELVFSEQSLDEDEFVEVVRLPFDEAVRSALSGKISDAKSIIGILWASERLKTK